MARHDIALGMIDPPPNYQLVLATYFENVPHPWASPYTYVYYLCIVEIYVESGKTASVP